MTDSKAEKKRVKKSAPRAQAPPTDQSVGSKEALLSASVKVFAEKGYEGATVKDIAEAAGMNISMVSYYFNGKEGLYKAVVESIGRERIQLLERMLKPATNIEEFKLRLRLFLEEFLFLHLQQPNTCKIIHRDFDGGHAAATEAFHDLFLELFGHFQKFITASKQAKILREDLREEICGSMIFGSMLHTLRMDPLLKKVMGYSLQDSEFFETYVTSLVESICYGICVR